MIYVNQINNLHIALRIIIIMLNNTLFLTKTTTYSIYLY